MFQIKTMTTKWPQLSVGAERGKKASPFLYWKKINIIYGNATV